MSDESNIEEGAAATEQASEAGANAGNTETFSADYVRRLREENAKWRTKSKELEAQLGGAVKPEELADLKAAHERLAADLAARDAQAKKAELTAMRLRVAGETGLPVALAERLAGEDEDSIRADAAKLAEVLPPAPTTGTVTRGVPAGKAEGKTRAQRYTDVYGDNI